MQLRQQVDQLRPVLGPVRAGTGARTKSSPASRRRANALPYDRPSRSNISSRPAASNPRSSTFTNHAVPRRSTIDQW
ncbi:hypothetical protein [Micromonospora sp. U56]|uniref:hypothetical protein n=1 Tax=Micromonospora sp. U56 TaxID=2824900 RepID=UPI0035A8DAF2